MEAKNLEERKEINIKATTFVRDKTRITMENRHEFEAIVREVNKHLGGVKKKTIQQLQQMAEDSPFTVVKCGEPLQQLLVSDDEEEESFPYLRSNCKMTFRDVKSRREHL